MHVVKVEQPQVVGRMVERVQHHVRQMESPHGEIVGRVPRDLWFDDRESVYTRRDKPVVQVEADTRRVPKLWQMLRGDLRTCSWRVTEAPKFQRRCFDLRRWN